MHVQISGQPFDLLKCGRGIKTRLQVKGQVITIFISDGNREIRAFLSRRDNYVSEEIADIVWRSFGIKPEICIVRDESGALSVEVEYLNASGFAESTRSGDIFVDVISTATLCLSKLQQSMGTLVRP